MAQVLELRDGGLVTPRNVFDVLEAVEEYAGIEIRQYLEDYMLEDHEEETEDERFDALRDHYQQVLVNVNEECFALERMLARGRKKDIQTQLEKIRKMVNREIKEARFGG